MEVNKSADGGYSIKVSEEDIAFFQKQYADNGGAPVSIQHGDLMLTYRGPGCFSLDPILPSPPGDTQNPPRPGA